MVVFSHRWDSISKVISTQLFVWFCGCPKAEVRTLTLYLWTEPWPGSSWADFKYLPSTSPHSWGSAINKGVQHGVLLVGIAVTTQQTLEKYCNNQLHVLPLPQSPPNILDKYFQDSSLALITSCLFGLVWFALFVGVSSLNNTNISCSTSKNLHQELDDIWLCVSVRKKPTVLTDYQWKV